MLKRNVCNSHSVFHIMSRLIVKKNSVSIAANKRATLTKVYVL